MLLGKQEDHFCSQLGDLKRLLTKPSLLHGAHEPQIGQVLSSPFINREGISIQRHRRKRGTGEDSLHYHFC